MKRQLTMEVKVFEVKKFENLSMISDLSRELVRGHISLYEGYVKNANKSVRLTKKAGKSYEFGEVKRRFGWEYNGVKLHELYFESFVAGGCKLEPNNGFTKLIDNKFGSFEEMLDQIKSVASIRGIGWVVLYYDKEREDLFVTWINEHDGGHLSACVPLLVIDLFEHAFMPDRLKKDEYLQIVFDNLCWQTVAKRYNKAK